MPERYTLRKGPDLITVEILDDGRTTFVTDKVSPKNHTDAEHLFAHVEQAHGSKFSVKGKKGTLEHGHETGHMHAH